MKRNSRKFIFKTVIAVLLLPLAASVLSSCAVERSSPDECYALLQDAVKNALAEPYYYWEDNLNLEEDKAAEIQKQWNWRTARYIPDKTTGTPVLYVKAEDLRGLYEEIISGSSPSKNKKNAEKIDYAFISLPLDGKKYKQQISAESVVKSDAYGGEYSVLARLVELGRLTMDDMEFNTFKQRSKTTGEVTELYFSVKDEYIESYGAETGKPSIFKYSKRVFVEIAYGRVSNITCYKDRQMVASETKSEFWRGLFTVENDYYKFKITYSGGKIEIPQYDGDEWKNAVVVEYFSVG
ncbi:MAG: hypothetical protein LBQ40_01050 [Clostridiales bacterium]|jgi:hypothetical protein|nr:hypothetical protein [Clostridiales bacterium]